MSESPHDERPRKKRQLVAAGSVPAPHSLEAEEYLLSCIMLDGATVMPKCLAARLKPESFYLAAHGIAFERLQALHERGQPCNEVVLAEDLKSAGLLDTVGGFAFLTHISSRMPTIAQADFFLEKVRERWILRQIIRRAATLRQEAENFTDGPMAELLSPHVQWFNDAQMRVASGGRGEIASLAARIGEVREDVKLRAAGKEDRSGWIWTGFSAFDDLSKDDCLRPFNSLEEDGIVLIGGGSSHGKSVLMRQFAGEALRTGQRVAVYSLETSVKGFCRSLAASWAGVNLLMLARTPPDLLRKFDEHLEELTEMADRRLFVFQNEAGSAIATIEDLSRHARQFSMRHGTPHLMIVDYLQRLDTKKRYNSGEQRVATVAHGTQELQRELGCCLIGGAQFNEAALADMRTVKRDQDGKLIHQLPTRGAFRESQALYHDADVALLLYRPPEDCRGADQTAAHVPTPEMWVCQDKRRNGRLGIQRLWFEKRFGRFRELGASEAGSGVSPGAGTVPAGARVSKTDFRNGGKKS